MKILTIIPARGGSKGLPNKNIRNLLGKPLIAWSIDTAKELNEHFDNRIVVSTDSEEIANVAKEYGAEIPFLRPAHLATDEASTMDVILHVIDFFEQKNEVFDLILLLEPTSPQRTAADVQSAIAQLTNTPDAESIVGICQAESSHPAFLVKLEDQFLRSYQNKTFEVIRRQDIEDFYFFEGSLYLSYTESLKKRKNFYHEQTLGYVVPKWKSFEVDDMTDLVIIEALLKAKQDNLIQD